MGAERQKGKFPIFRFGVVRVLGMKSLTYRFLYEVEKRLSTPSKKLMEVQATISRTDLTKLQTLGSIILLSFFGIEYVLLRYLIRKISLHIRYILAHKHIFGIQV